MIIIILIIMLLYKYHFNINSKYISLCLLLILIINELYFKKNMSLCKNCIYEQFTEQVAGSSPVTTSVTTSVSDPVSTSVSDPVTTSVSDPVVSTIPSTNNNRISTLDASICDLNSHSALYKKQKNKLIDQNKIFRNINIKTVQVSTHDSTQDTRQVYDKYILNIDNNNNNNNLNKFNELTNNNIDKCELPCHLISVNNNMVFNSDSDKKKYKERVALKCETNLNRNNPDKTEINNLCSNYNEEKCNTDCLCNFNKKRNKCDFNQKKCILLKTDDNNKSICKNKCEYHDTKEKCNLTFIDFKNNLEGEKYCIWDNNNNKCKSLCNKYTTSIGCTGDNNCKIVNNKCTNK